MPDSLNDRLPVIVGIGEIVDRPSDPAQGKEPLTLMADALRLADQDAGGGLLQRLESLDVVNSITWGYSNLPARVCQALGIQPARAAYGVMGGQTPVQYIHDAAIRIAAGEIDFAAVCGGEAAESLLRAQQAKISLPWTPPDQEPERPKREGIIHASALRHGLNKPLVVYPIYEYATQAAWGQSFDEAQAETGELWSQLSAVAAKNPYAWRQRFYEPSEIFTPSKENRRVAGPYTKLMVANPTVNQGAAVLLTSFGRAKAMGISEDRMVFIWGGSAASEPADFVSRDQYHHSTAMDAVLEHAQQLCRDNGTEPGMVELYSCFPCVPKMARRVLNWPIEKLPTVAGGLSFFGGPYNNYMTHAATAMTRKLREREESVGLLFGNGGFATKHHALIVAARPPEKPLSSSYAVQDDADRRRGPIPAIEEEFVGEAKLETYTVLYDRAGEPEAAVVFIRTPAGSRALARVGREDANTLAVLAGSKRSAIGTKGATLKGNDGLLQWAL